MSLAPDLKVYEKEGYRFYHHYDNIVIFNDREENIEVSPSESTTLIGCLDVIGRMISLKTLPPWVKERPFEICFSEAGRCMLTRDEEPAGLSFMMEDVDFLIEGIQQVVRKLVDLKTLRAEPNAAAPPSTPEVPIDGRL